MKPVLVAVVLAGVIALGAIDIFLFSGQPSTAAATAGSPDTTLAAQSLATPPMSSCWVPGDLIGEADPASIHCLAP